MSSQEKSKEKNKKAENNIKRRMGRASIINKLRKEHKYFKAVIQHKMIDCTYANFRNKNICKRISKTEYMKYYTTESGIKVTDGKVYKYAEKTDEKGNRNIRRLKQIFSDLKQLVNANFNSDFADRQFFVTLTYKENMQDEKRLYKDFNSFWKRLKYAMPEHELEYITISEPQGRGAWHMHMLLKSNTPFNSGLYHYQKIIYNTWKQGRTELKKLETVNNLGCYFVAYLSNAELSPEKIKDMKIRESDIITARDTKKYVKGERLKYYKDYFKIYRSSKGIKKPEITHDENIIQEYPKITYQTLSEIEIDENKPKIVVAKEQRRKDTT
jgi:hypothetical protein